MYGLFGFLLHALMKRPFWVGFVLGVLAALSGVELLSAPGVIATLLFHNLVQQWWWAISLIVIANGLIYGGIAAGIARVIRKP